ncbi:MAG TPA: MFS transporter [Pseudonocardiaceae bacterium]
MDYPAQPAPPALDTGLATGGSLAAVAARLDRLPLSRWHRRMVLLIGLGTFFTFFEVTLGSFFGVLLGRQWPLTTFDLAMIIASTFVGEMIGSLVLAPYADRLGRRTLFQVNLVVYAVLSLATAFSPNLLVFLALRVLTGFGLGAELTLVDTYLSELLPSRRRGRFIAWSYTLGMLAVPVAGGLAKAANGTLFGLQGWRWLLILGACAGLAVWLFRRGLPESPRWLAATGKADEADRVLTSIEQRVVPLNRQPLSTSEEIEPEVPATAAVTSVAESPDDRYGRRNLLVWVMWILQPIGFYTFASIAPLVLLAKGFDLSHSLAFSALTALGYPLGSLVSVFLTERSERRTLLVASTLATAAFGVAFGLASGSVLIIVAGALTSVSSVVQNNIQHIYQTELFHTANRSTSIGRPYAASRVVSALLPFAALALLSALGASGLYICSALLLVVMVVAVRVLGPRTNGRRLDTI